VTKHLLEFLAERLAPGQLTIGEVICSSDFRLWNASDTGQRKSYFSPEDAHEISLFTDAGEYRPLKTAPNLRTGWELRLQSLTEVRTAMDLLYPAALANAWAYFNGRLHPTPMRDTLLRQSGMYAITRKLTDQQAAPLISKVCDKATACRNLITWDLNSAEPTPLTEKPDQLPPGTIPLLCTEACCLLIAAARDVVKASFPRPEKPAA